MEGKGTGGGAALPRSARRASCSNRRRASRPPGSHASARVSPVCRVACTQAAPGLHAARRGGLSGTGATRETKTSAPPGSASARSCEPSEGPARSVGRHLTQLIEQSAQPVSRRSFAITPDAWCPPILSVISVARQPPVAGTLFGRCALCRAARWSPWAWERAQVCMAAAANAWTGNAITTRRTRRNLPSLITRSLLPACARHEVGKSS